MTPPGAPPCSVVVTRSGDDWLVVVTEGLAIAQRTFGLEAGAESFAFGQRVRLGLPPPPLPAPPEDRSVPPDA